MVYHGVECERVDQIAPEAYVCRWKDRNTLAVGLLAEGKGVIFKEQAGTKESKGIYRDAHAMLVVDSYSPELKAPK